MVVHQADEAFFIDSDEPLHTHMDPRTAAKMIAHNRQDIIAGELSRLDREEYLENIMQHKRQVEASLYSGLAMINWSLQRAFALSILTEGTA